MINLCLVVIATQFSETKKREIERMAMERRRYQSTSTLGSSIEPNSCYGQIFKLVGHKCKKIFRRLMTAYSEFQERRGVKVVWPAGSDIELNRHPSFSSNGRVPGSKAEMSFLMPPFRCPRKQKQYLETRFGGSLSLAQSTDTANAKAGSSSKKGTTKPAKSFISRPMGILNCFGCRTQKVELSQVTAKVEKEHSSSHSTENEDVIRELPEFYLESENGPSIGPELFDSVSFRCVEEDSASFCAEPYRAPYATPDMSDLDVRKHSRSQERRTTVQYLDPNSDTTTQRAHNFDFLRAGLLPNQELDVAPKRGDLLSNGRLYSVDNTNYYSSVYTPYTARHQSYSPGLDYQSLNHRPYRLPNQSMGVVVKIRNAIKRLVEHRFFGRVILLAILINTISMGIEHHQQPEELTGILESSNRFFTILFLVEMILKILGEGPIGYLSNGFNLFDGIIVVISVAELFMMNGHNPSGLSVLRTFRLLRILKLVRFLPALRRQLLVMLRTMDNVATFFALLVLFIFVFSILGRTIFGGKFCSHLNGSPCSCADMQAPVNDCKCDRANFDKLHWALVTVFQILTQEDWNIVLYTGMSRTSSWAALYFVALMTFGNYVLFNLLVAILVEGFSSERTNKSELTSGGGSDNESKSSNEYEQDSNSRQQAKARKKRHKDKKLELERTCWRERCASLYGNHSQLPASQGFMVGKPITLGSRVSSAATSYILQPKAARLSTLADDPTDSVTLQRSGSARIPPPDHSDSKIMRKRANTQIAIARLVPCYGFPPPYTDPRTYHLGQQTPQLIINAPDSPTDAEQAEEQSTTDSQLPVPPLITKTEPTPFPTPHGSPIKSILTGSKSTPPLVKSPSLKKVSIINGAAAFVWLCSNGDCVLLEWHRQENQV
ncbi:hypothetical protein Ciccas_001018 [Cichlidogyrus casuarinus]|uniref:Ion transport domain-containing protein n=1 Tax=Cichlidogyrus casuarinus TaxID=1844966 RepID=A0ABD2QL94_9PLAT